MSIPQGAGGLYSTTEDLLKWEQGLFRGKVLKPSLEKMTTPFKSNYAFGLEVETANGHKVIQHNGGIEGFNTILAYYPDEKLTVVVLANVNGNAPGGLAAKLAALCHGEAVTLTSERKEITLDPKTLSRYTGAYQLGPAPMLITVENQQLFSKLGNQPAVPIFPESPTRFFLKVVDAQLEFSKDDNQGRPTQLTLHQDGRDIIGKRLIDTEAKRLTDAAAAVARRIKDQTAAPGSEAALRKMIEDVRAGKPDYATMSAGFAEATRQQLPQLQTSVTQLGQVQSVKFKGVGPAGPDIYDVKFENGSLEYRVWLAVDGKVESANVRPLQ